MTLDETCSSTIVPFSGKELSKGRRVLIVDDDPDFAETIAEMLTPKGYVVHLAHTYEDAIASLSLFPPQVSLLDIRLGRDSGTDLISSIKSAYPEVLCVMMTGYAALETAIQALKDGAYDYMRKPISSDDLFHTLDRCFHNIELVQAKERSELALAQRNLELEKINERLRLVVQAAERMAACTRFSELCPLLLHHFAKVLMSQGGSLYLVKQDRLAKAISLEMPHAPDEIEFPLAFTSVFHHVFTTREPLLIEDFPNSPFSRSSWEGYANGSALVFPILGNEGKLLAIISLHNKETPPFTAHDKEIGVLLLSLSTEVLRALQAFEAVAESQRRFSELTHLLPAVVFELDEAYHFTYLNREVSHMTQYSPDELIGRHFSQLLPESEHERAIACLDQAHCNGNADDDFTLQRKDNQHITILLQTAAVERAGEVIGLRGLLFDITQRKKTEAEHAQLAMAVEQAAELILITDVNGLILYANPAFLTLTGYRREDVQNLNFHNFENAKDDPTFYEKLWETLKRGQTWSGRVRGYKANDEVYVAEASISPLRGPMGHVANYVAVLRDLTHEAKLEARLRQAEKLEAIGTLAGGIAHDFNNILSPIIGFTEIVREDLPPGSESIAHLEKVLNACHLAKDLVSRILTFSRKMETERKAVQVHQVVLEALKLLRPSIPSTIAILEQIDVNAGFVLGDPSQLHQIIMNLVTNAYQAIREKGEIRVLLATLCADEDLVTLCPRLIKGQRYLSLDVSDNGIGMNKRVLARIFDPFFSTKDQGKGTGLGLATVHGIVMELNGDIAVTSEPVVGTKVRVFLPSHIPLEGEEKKATLDESRAGKGRILLVDDEEMILQLGKMMLGRLGYQVVTYSHSPSALEHFLENPSAYDLIITDQTMPALTGQQLARTIKDEKIQIPVLLTTGFSSMIREDQMMANGICQIIHKPFTRKEMGDAVSAAMALANN